MRRDLHKWFFVGVAFSIAATIVGCILQDDASAMAMLLAMQAIVLLIGFSTMYRRRAWREVCATMRDSSFRSHELRCRLLADDPSKRTRR
jgi:hypothetical protein